MDILSRPFRPMLDVRQIGATPILALTLRTYAAHYNRQRPHRAVGLATPLAEASITVPVPVSPRDVCRRDLLGGLIHEYYGAAA